MEILKVKTKERELGDFGESEAVKFLKKHGYRILKRNYVALGHEVDIIAEMRDVIAFVEVKTRTVDKLSQRQPRPASAVTHEKQRNIIMAAKSYIAYHRPNKRVRLDIIEVYAVENGKKLGIREIKHLEDAFNKNTAYSHK